MTNTNRVIVFGIILHKYSISSMLDSQLFDADIFSITICFYYHDVSVTNYNEETYNILPNAEKLPPVFE